MYLEHLRWQKYSRLQMNGMCERSTSLALSQLRRRLRFGDWLVTSIACSLEASAEDVTVSFSAR